MMTSSGTGMKRHIPSTMRLVKQEMEAAASAAVTDTTEARAEGAGAVTRTRSTAAALATTSPSATTAAAADGGAQSHELECFIVNDEECPWDWCRASDTAGFMGPMDIVKHHHLCLVSKDLFSCSGMHNSSREELWAFHGFDPWKRDEDGRAIRAFENEREYSKPPKNWAPTAEQWKEWGFEDEDDDEVE